MTEETRKAKRKSWTKRRRWLFMLLALLLVWGSPLFVQAHIVPEEPWHPAPASYLRSLFYANLKPTNWALIDEEYKTVSEPEFAGILDSVYQALDAASTIEGIDHVTEIQTSIDKRDKAKLYFASTRAISQLTRYYLHEAAGKLTQPGVATADVQQARRIYRAFQDFISQADPEANKQLGIAWLDLASSVGHGGIAGVGSTASDPAQFNAAQQVIETYLMANF